MGRGYILCNIEGEEGSAAVLFLKRFHSSEVLQISGLPVFELQNVNSIDSILESDTQHCFMENINTSVTVSHRVLQYHIVPRVFQCYIECSSVTQSVTVSHCT